MKFSIEISLKTDLGTLPNIGDVYLTFLPGTSFKEVANKDKIVIKFREVCQI